MKIFDLKNISYSYTTEKKAINDISLEIFSGEKIAILGPNGCGKTTLLSILDGLIFPDKGRFMFYGQEVSEKKFEDSSFNSNFRRKVGYVFQNPDVQLFCPTVKDELLFGPRQISNDISEFKDNLDKTIEIFNLETLLDKAPFNLSYGEKKRVSLASVFILNPDVILLDEPTASLDPKNKRNLLYLIHRLNEEGKTIITTTHDLDIIGNISDRVLLFGGNNSIIRSDSSYNITNDHNTMMLAGLI